MAVSEGPRRSGRQPSLPRPARRRSTYETLKQAILSGDLEPGQPLVEAVLASWCGVSRTPIREALTRLEQDGLVDRSDRGMLVRQRSVEEILDIYETLLALEATAGGVAADRRTPHDVRALRRLLQRTDEVLPDDLRGIVAVNRQFHRAVWRASHNESLVDLLERLNLHLARYPETTLSHPEGWTAAKRDHKRLVDAIELRDRSAAYEIAHKHITAARNRRLVLFDQEDSEY